MCVTTGTAHTERAGVDGVWFLLVCSCLANRREHVDFKCRLSLFLVRFMPGWVIGCPLHVRYVRDSFPTVILASGD